MVRPSSADINIAQLIGGNYPQKMSAKSAHFGLRVHGEKRHAGVDQPLQRHLGHATAAALRHRESPSGQ